MNIPSKKTIINILPHQSAYNNFKDEELPGKNWRNKKGEIIGITGNEFPHSLGNAILKATGMFNYEVWQPDLRADEIISHIFDNKLIYRLMPAINKKKIYGLKFVNEIHSEILIREIEKKAKTGNIIINLNGSLSGLNKEIFEKINNTSIVFSFHSSNGLPSRQFFMPTRNIPCKVNLILEHFWIKRNINKIKCITYCSDENAQDLVKIYKYKGKIRKVTMGCDFTLFKKMDKNICRQELNLPRNKFIMVTVANFNSGKQIDKFIKVLIKIMPKYDFLYLIVGQGIKEYEEYLKKLATPLSRENKVRFIGYLRGQALLKYLNSADLFISASISEGGPVSVMEAMACELPIFSTKTGHTAELMEKQDAACLVGIRDYDTWEKELEKILGAKELPKILDRNIAREHYDWENIAKEFIRIYENNKKTPWQNYERNYWEYQWENSLYSIQDKIDGDRWVSVKHSPLLPYILKYTPKNVKILEAGCGLGQWVIYLASLGYDITGLDFAQSTIKKLQNFSPGLQFIVGDVTNFEFGDEYFGAILSWGVVEHFEAGPAAALNEAHRILTKKGILFIAVPCKNYLFLLFSPFLYIKRKIARIGLVRKILNKKSVKTVFFEYNFTKKQFTRHITKAGFSIKEIIPIGHEGGFVKAINTLLRVGRETKLFQKNKIGKWGGLTPAGNIICRFLKRISPWITPDQIFIIAEK